MIEFNQNPDCGHSDMKNASKWFEPKFAEALSSIRDHRGIIHLLRCHYLDRGSGLAPIQVAEPQRNRGDEQLIQAGEEIAWGFKVHDQAFLPLASHDLAHLVT